ncbi:LamG-like jellyroll fold domain-containing protein, partial [Spirochaetota bacterium]
SQTNNLSFNTVWQHGFANVYANTNIYDMTKVNTNNVNLDPKYASIDPASADFLKLSSYSPCIKTASDGDNRGAKTGGGSNSYYSASGIPYSNHKAGHISGTETWPAGTHPIIIVGSIWLDAGVDITVEPGARIEYLYENGNLGDNTHTVGNGYGKANMSLGGYDYGSQLGIQFNIGPGLISLHGENTNRISMVPYDNYPAALPLYLLIRDSLGQDVVINNIDLVQVSIRSELKTGTFYYINNKNTAGFWVNNNAAGNANMVLYGNLFTTTAGSYGRFNSKIYYSHNTVCGTNQLDSYSIWVTDLLNITNSILYHPGPGASSGIKANGGTLNSSYNIVAGYNDNFDGYAAGANDLEIDPKFVDIVNSNYHLMWDSPALGTGKPNSAGLSPSRGKYSGWLWTEDESTDALTTHRLIFTTTATNPYAHGAIPGNGLIEIDYPIGFDLSTVTAATQVTTAGTNALTFGVSGTTITMTNSGTSVPPGETVGIYLFGVKNHSNVGSNYYVTFTTMSNDRSLIDGPEDANMFRLVEGMSTGLVAYYPFNNNADDESGNGNDGTPTGAILTNDRYGETNAAFFHDGAGDYITIDSTIDDVTNTDIGTWSFWIRPTNVGGAMYETYVSFGDTDANTFLLMRKNNADKVEAVARTIGTTQWAVTTDIVPLENEKWTHVTITHNGTQPYFYINGTSAAITFDTDVDRTIWFNDITGIDNARIGDMNVNLNGEGTFLNGFIDEIYVYTRVLTSNEILLLAAKPTILITESGTPYTNGGNAFDFGTTNAGDSITVTFTVTNKGLEQLDLSNVILSGTDPGHFSIASPPGSYSLAPSNSTTFQLSFAPTNGGVKTATVIISNSDFNNDPYTFDIQGYGLGLLAYYPFNNNANDESGNANHGTPSNNVQITNDRFGSNISAYWFDGYNDFIEAPNSDTLDLTNSCTISAWINTTTTNIGGGGEYQFILSKGKAANFPRNYLMLMNQDALQLSWYNGSYVVLQTNIVTPNNWHLITYTFDKGSDTWSLYWNGEKVLQSNGCVTMVSNDYTFRIGANDTGTNVFSGRIDDVRLYNYALTSNKITNLYHEGGWPPIEGADWICATNNAAFPKRRTHQAVVFKDKLWIIGGYDGVNKNDVWYSSDGADWYEATNNAAFSDRDGHTTTIYDGKMWLIGGNSSGFKNDIWYSSDGTNWYETTNSAPFTARNNCKSVVYDNKMWVIGGYDGIYLNDVWYSSDGTNWYEATNNASFSGINGHQALVYDNKMWIMGGYGNNGNTNDVWYSTDGASWYEATNSAAFTKRRLHSSCVFDSKMWVIAGLDTVKRSDVWYSTNGSHWTEASSNCAFDDRWGQQATVYRNRIWLTAGQAAAYTNDVWYSVATANTPPVAWWNVDSTSGTTNYTFSLHASNSYDVDVEALSYEWDTDGDGFDDGASVALNYQFVTTGTQWVAVRVTDPSSAQDVYSNYIVVEEDTGLVGYYPFNGNANDESGTGNHGTLTNGVTITNDRYEAGNSAYLFDGTDDYILVPHDVSLDITGEGTWGAWIYLHSFTNNSVRHILSKFGGGAGERQYILQIEREKVIGIAIRKSDDSDFVFCSNSTTFPLNRWTHVAATYDKNVNPSLRLFQDGLLVRSNNLYSGDLQTGANIDFKISSDLYPYDGMIDEGRVYNRALSVDEIKALAAKPTILITESGTSYTNGGAAFNFGITNAGESNTVTFYITNTGLEQLNVTNIFLSGTDPEHFNIFTQPEDYTLAPTNATMFQVQFKPTNAGEKNATVVISNSDFNNSVYTFNITGTGKGLLVYYPFTGNASNTAYNANHGTVTAAVLTNDRYGKASNAYSFDGASSQIDFGTIELGNNNNISAALWYNSYTSAEWRHQLELGIVEHGWYGSFRIATGDTGDNVISMGDTAVASDTHIYPPWLDNEWHHIAFTYSNNGLHLYYDGKWATIDNVNLNISAGDGTLLMGVRAGGTRRYHGALDEAYVYNRVLTANEVAQLAAKPTILITESGTPYTNGGAAFDFGATNAGESNAVTFTITNTGLEELILTGVPSAIIIGANASHFSLIAQPAGSNIAAESATNFQVQFNPTTGGPKNATVVIYNNDFHNSTYQFDITGMGIGLMAYYPFELNANDVSGNAYDGGATNTIATNDRFSSNNSAYYFDGNAYIDLNQHVPDFNAVSNGTVSFWFQVPLGETNAMDPVYFGDQSSVQNTLRIYIGGDTSAGWSGESFEVGIMKNAVQDYRAALLDGMDHFSDSRWHHFVWAVGNSGNKLYFDGKDITGDLDYQNGSSNIGNLLFNVNNADVFYLGARKTGGNPFDFHFNGRIDDVSIYNYALSFDEATNLYHTNNWPPPDTNGPVISSFIVPTNTVIIGNTTSITCTLTDSFSDISNIECSIDDTNSWNPLTVVGAYDSLVESGYTNIDPSALGWSIGDLHQIFFRGWDIAGNVSDITNAVIAVVTNALPTDPADWTAVKYAANPVMAPQGAGFDDSAIRYQTVMYHSNMYKMYYSAQGGSWTIGYAESSNGIDWTNRQQVLSTGAGWDSADVISPFVITNNGVYRMWYTGVSGVTRRIGYAESSNGITWTKYPNNPVIDLGSGGTWNDSHVSEPSVIYDNGLYKMWFAGDDGSYTRIGYAVSTNGIDWAMHPANPVLDRGTAGSWDDYHAGIPRVIKDGNLYRMWYSGFDSPNWHIGNAWSYDGITWQKYALNPLVTIGSAGAWDDRFAYNSAPVKAGSNYKIWYTGYNNTIYRIGYACIDFEAPQITSATLSTNLITVPNNILINAFISDETNGILHIAKAEYYIDSMGTNTGTVLLGYSNGFNSAYETWISNTIPWGTISGLTNGEHTVYMHACDGASNWSAWTAMIFTNQFTLPVWVASNSGTGVRYTNIQEAVDTASNTHTVYVFPGIHNLNLNITNKIDISVIALNYITNSNDNTNTVILPPVPGPVTIQNSALITFQGFLINGNSDAVGGTGFTIDNSFSNYILNNNIWSNGDAGIQIMNNSINNFITSNHIYKQTGNGMREGIDIRASYNYIEYNTIFDHTGGFGGYSGLLLSSATNNIIRNNTFYSNDNAIGFWGQAKDNIVSNNTIYDSMENGIYISSCQNSNTITSNLIYDSIGSGINIDSSSDQCIFSNRIYNNGSNGIYVTGSGPIEISDNDIFSNQYDGIRLTNNTSLCIISENTIFNNNDQGICITTNCMENKILSNNIWGSAQNNGIYLNFADSNSIMSNRIGYHSSSGISCNNSGDNTIDLNYIYSNSSHGLFIDGLYENNSGVSNIIFNNTGDGVWINYTTLYLSYSRIYNNTSGIHVDMSSRIYSLTNLIYSNTNGIYIEEGNGHATVISNNIFDNQSYGFYSADATGDTTVRSSLIHNNESGLNFNNPSTSNPVLEVINNSIYANAAYGIYANTGESRLLITSNVIYNTGSNTVYLSSNHNAQIHLNTISNTAGTGLRIDQYSTNNTVKLNNLYCSTNIITISPAWNNIFLSNNYSTMNFTSVQNSIIGTNSNAFVPYRFGTIGITQGDTAPPFTPTNVSASGTASNVILSWNDAGPDTAGYRVYRSVSIDTWTNFSAYVTNITGAGTTTWTDSKTGPGTNYFYYISAFDSASPYENESWWSASAGAHVLVEPVVYITNRSNNELVWGSISLAGVASNGSDLLTELFFTTNNTGKLNITLITNTITDWATNTFDTASLADGTNTFVFYLVDAADQTNSNSISLVIDNSAPLLSFNAAYANTTMQAVTNISGIVYEPHTSALGPAFIISTNGIPVTTHPLTLTGISNWATNINTAAYANGYYDFILSASNSTGLASAITQTNVYFTNDTGFMQVTSPAAYAVISGVSIITGYIVPGSFYPKASYMSNSATSGWAQLTMPLVTNWYTNYDAGALSDGTNFFQFMFVDSNDYTNDTAFRYFIVDNSPPFSAVTNNGSGSIIYGKNVSVSGTNYENWSLITANVLLTNSGIYTWTNASPWLFSFDSTLFVNGALQLGVIVSNSVSLTYTNTWTVYVSNTPPIVSITNPLTAAWLTSSSYTFAGWASNEFGILSGVYFGTNASGFSIVSGTSNWSTNVDLSSLADSTNVFYVMASNEYGMC